MRVLLTDKPIDLNEVVRISECDSRVALISIGRSRKFSEQDEVNAVFYETYEEIAQKILEKLLADSMDRFHLSDAIVVHRLGKIPVGETAYVVAVYSQRQEDAFQACKFIVDEMASELPVWKYETRKMG
ncbi:MAG: molybdenum cofactor biosynthesis protein MoaE [Thermoplasmataceae archaeon]